MNWRAEPPLDWTHVPRSDNKILLSAALVAFVIEFAALTLFGLQTHWMTHVDQIEKSPAFIEASVFEMPKMEHLMEEKKIAAPQPHEAVLSKVPDQGKKTETKPQADESNQTTGGPPLAPTHGPVATYAPPPVIPDYLRDKDIKTSAVIDFYISATGDVDPKLVGSTGDEELDALALKTVKKWQFRPAEQDHKPVAAKIRLRIIFQVH
jgi:TonB family protein